MKKLKQRLDDFVLLCFVKYYIFSEIGKRKVASKFESAKKKILSVN